MAKKITSKDISNRTVVVMLVVVIVVSIVALGVYLNALDKAEPKIQMASSGEMSLTIAEPPAEPAPAVEGGSGKLGLTIAEPPEEKGG